MAAVKEELGGCSYRLFQRSKDGYPEKAVILDFSSGLSLWAQYAQDDRDINKWEILAERHGFDGKPGDTTFTIFFDNPNTRQEIPTTGDGCKETARFSIIVELREEEHTRLLKLKNTFRHDDFSRSRA